MNTDPVAFKAILVCRRCRWMQAEVVDSVLSQLSELSVWYMEIFSHTRCVVSRLACLHSLLLFCTDDSIFWNLLAKTSFTNIIAYTG